MDEERYGSEVGGKKIVQNPISVTEKGRDVYGVDDSNDDSATTSVTEAEKHGFDEEREGAVREIEGQNRDSADDWAVEELGAKVSEMLGGLEKKRRARSQRMLQAQMDAGACGICGKPFGSVEVVWRGEAMLPSGQGSRPTLLPMCDPCRSKGKDQWWDHRWTEPEPCEGCGRPVRNLISPSVRRRYVSCSEACRRKIQKSREGERRALARLKVCATCREPFEGERSDAKYCSPACRQKAYRQRAKKPRERP